MSAPSYDPLTIIRIHASSFSFTPLVVAVGYVIDAIPFLFLVYCLSLSMCNSSDSSLINIHQQQQPHNPTNKSQYILQGPISFKWLFSLLQGSCSCFPLPTDSFAMNLPSSSSSVYCSTPLFSIDSNDISRLYNYITFLLLSSTSFLLYITTMRLLVALMVKGLRLDA